METLQDKARLAVSSRFSLPEPVVDLLVDVDLQQASNLDLACQLNPLPISESGIPHYTIRLTGFGELEDRAVAYLDKLPAGRMVSSEATQDIRSHPSYTEYLELARQGSEPPAINVVKHRDGKLVSQNRRRLLVAQELDQELWAWIESDTSVGGSTLTYSDFKRAWHESVYGVLTAKYGKLLAELLAEVQDDTGRLSATELDVIIETLADEIGEIVEEGDLTFSFFSGYGEVLERRERASKESVVALIEGADNLESLYGTEFEMGGSERRGVLVPCQRGNAIKLVEFSRISVESHKSFPNVEDLPSYVAESGFKLSSEQRFEEYASDERFVEVTARLRSGGIRM